MSARTVQLDDRLYAYFQKVSLREPEILRRLRDETVPLPRSSMLLSPEQGQFLSLLVELLGVRRAIEIGTFTGYSGFCIARALQPGGRLICCDVSEEWTRIARRYWEEGKLSDRIDLRLGPALDTLDRILEDGGAGTFDFAFIDADKENYEGYYERVLTLLRPGGLVAVDNVLWGGSVADPDKDDANTRALRAFNEKVHGDERVSLSLVPIGDGLTLARKRA